ncbi:MAG: hypothetical protein EA385_06530 [Salinarimonadaceae bacterium]|nr:MAG: hypothetical protein EA385_06530 [Salinarimonadaceae bacterium]
MMRTAFVLVVVALAVAVIWTAADFRRAARLFPVVAGYATLAICALELMRQFIRRRLLAPEGDDVSTADIAIQAEESGLDGLKRGLGVFGWVLGYMALIMVLGMPWATVLFVPLLLHLRFQSDWRATLGIVLGLLVLMWTLKTFLMMRMPPGLLNLPLLP